MEKTGRSDMLIPWIEERLEVRFQIEHWILTEMKSIESIIF